MQTQSNPQAAQFLTAAAAMPTPVCVTAFITAKSLVEATEEKCIAVGTYMSDRSIWNIVTFQDIKKAVRYAFKLKAGNCPISKHAFALLNAELKAANERLKALNEAKEKAAEKAAEKAKQEAEAVEKDTYKVSVTPLMKQYEEMKKKHPDAILLFRVGDFYECFGEDAADASEILGITLTRRANGKAEPIKLAGFPHHALDKYLPKLVRAGRRVAICEQLEEPKKAAKRSKKATAVA